MVGLSCFCGMSRRGCGLHCFIWVLGSSDPEFRIYGLGFRVVIRFWVIGYIGVILGLYLGYIGVIMGLYYGYIGVMLGLYSQFLKISLF